MPELSDIADKIDGQPMFQVLAKVQEMERSGKEIIHFELGEPDFSTPDNIISAAVSALNSGFTHYENSMGLMEFRKAAQETTGISRGFLPDIDQVLVTSGANAIIYLSIRCSVNPGEEVIVPDPGFPTYYSAIKVCGAIPVRVPLREENDFKLDPAELKSKITSKTRMVILNSPSNPTGAVLSAEDIAEICAVCAQHDLFILSDEIYSRLTFDEDSSFFSASMIDHCRERTIVLNGFSKAFAMTGWRLGVAIGPTELISRMALLQETIVSCVPPFIQMAGVEAIQGDQSSIINMKNEYSKRRLLLVDGLNSVKGIDCVLPRGAIYAFPNVSGTGMNGEEFTDHVLSKAGIALLPGTNFGEYATDFVRLSYVTDSGQITRAIDALKELFGSQ
jgi:aspartate/methionine/tyrosine aminotransferase